MREEWKIIKDFPNYKVSNKGEIFSNITKRILKKTISKRGYHIIRLSRNKKSYTKYIYKLVAQEFLKHTPSGYEEVVDHIDRNRLNDNLDNLQLLTQRRNSIRSKDVNNIGVSYYNGKYYARIWFEGINYYLGTFTTQKEANEVYLKQLENVEKYNRIDENLLKRVQFTSKHKGIYYEKERSKWVAVSCVENKQKKLGRFNTENEAVIALNNFYKTNINGIKL